MTASDIHALRHAIALHASPEEIPFSSLPLAVEIVSLLHGEFGVVRVGQLSDSSLRTSVIDRLSPRQLEKLSELEENFNAIVVEEMVVRHQRVRLLEETLKETRTALRKLELSLKPVESEPSEATSRLASEIVSMITATARPVFHPGILQEVIQQFNEFGPKHRLALQVHPT